MFFFQSKKAQLQNVNYKDTEPFVVPLTDGKVIKVYDGDTITIASYLKIQNKKKLYRFSIRISNIDCCELRTKNENEKLLALAAKSFVENKLMHQMVTLKNIKTEKYGRILAEVYHNGENISNLLIQNQLAIPYTGGAKENVTEKLMQLRKGVLPQTI